MAFEKSQESSSEDVYSDDVCDILSINLDKLSSNQAEISKKILKPGDRLSAYISFPKINREKLCLRIENI